MRNSGKLYPQVLLTLILAASILTPARAQLSAAFTSDIVQGCTPLLVKFRDQSTGNPTYWRWDLGNGTISYFKNPAATYFNPGTYTVKLVVSNGSQTDSVVKLQYITVHALPVVNFAASDTTGCFPKKIKFTDFSVPGDGTIVKWLWDFGDGSVDSVQNPEHTYTGLGNYNVSLQVQNSKGCVSTLTRAQYIKLTSGVKASFSFSAPDNCRPPAAVSFTNSSTGTGQLTWQWDFGDGNTSTQQDPVHVYNSPGAYTVKLVVRNNNGCVDSLIQQQAINIGSVNANFLYSSIICAGNATAFINTSNPNPVSASWDFGDNTSSSSIHPVKTYTAPGTYTVRLVTNFGTCTDTVSKQITVLQKALASFSQSDSNACKAPLTVNFSSSVPGAVSYQWNFGDGGTGTGATPTHTYTANGTYDVTLVVTNAAGCSDTLRKQQLIQIRPAVVNITGLPLEGCAPLTYVPTVTVQTVDPIVSWSWDFGDGTTGTGQSPPHVYTNPGKYAVKLRYTTAGGCTDSVTATDSIRVGIKLQPNFTATPRYACAFQGINFTDLTTGGIADSWLWMFGDGSTSTAQHPSHIYQDTGYFHVTLIVGNNGCRDTLQFTNYIYIKPPVARFVDSFDCQNPFQRRFTDMSIGATSWFWNFGDGNTSTSQHPVHTYAAPGRYTVQLTVKNDTCEHFTLREVNIIAERADFTASDTILCKGDIVQFQSRNLNPANISLFIWDFGDDVVQQGGATVDHIYANSGIYTVQLVIEDINGCRDTLRRFTYIRVDGPKANFTSSVPGTCLNTPVIFNDASTTDGLHPIVSWIWDYGDGIIDTLTAPPFQHSYANAGTYSVKLTTIDNSGCQDSITRTSAFVISKPVAAFVSPDTLLCVNKPVRFTNASTGPGLSYTWDFGDGQTSSEQEPVHNYSSEGVYTVRLHVKDQYGCEDSLVRVAYISIRNPVAQFSMSDSVGTCPPLVVNFTNQSQNSVSHSWDFGDGTSSAIQNPLHFYNYPGTFRAMLTVSSVGGCVDSFSRTIVISGPQGTFSYDTTDGCVPTTIRFTAHTKDQVSFIWDFNDGTTVHTGDSVISHTYTQMGEYLPKMILRDPQGCQVPIVGIDTIRVYGVRAAMGMSTSLLCDSGRVFFRDSSVSNDLITSFYWTFGDGGTSTVRHPSHVYTQTGNYPVSLIVTTQRGCKDTVENISPLKIVQSPLAGITGDTAACAPALLDFQGALMNQDTSSVFQWRWDFGNDLTSDLQDPPAVTFQQPGNYPVRLILTNSSGCRDTAIFPVWARPLPEINANNDLIICRDASATLNVTGGVQYNWTPAAGLSCIDCPSPVANPDSTRRYRVTGRNIYGCENSDSLLITVKQRFNITTAIGDTLCKGESYRLSATGAELYTWSPAVGLNDAGSASPLARPDVTTMYRVIGRDAQNCFTDTGYVPVTVYPYPLVDAGKDETITVGSSVKLSPVISPDVTNITWSPAKWLDCINCPQPVASPKQTTKYTIRVANQGGCITTDDMTVFVVCLEGNLYLPNTFSPNGDGMNDVFYPRGKGIFGVKTFRIFNRWGEMIFERSNIQANDISKGWDGVYKGKLASQDVYVYTIDVICENNQVFSFKGNIALIR